MDDLISREQAIKQAYHICIDGDVFEVVQVETLMGLPSAQPDLQPTCNQLATDCISRQAAIDAIGKDIMGGLNYESILRDMPSARRKGRWEVTPVYIKGSECGESFMLIPQNFCPNCGAIME